MILKFRFIWSMLLLLTFVGCKTSSQQAYLQIREEFLDSSSSQVMVVAHRGDWRNAPENSLPSIRNCIAMGVDVVEIDVRKTKDNKLVLMHDGSINRTTTGKGAVNSFTLKELKQFNLKDKDGNPTEYKIPTLEEAMLEAKGQIMINLDKCYKYFDEVYTVLVKTETVDHVLMKGGIKADQVLAEFGQYLDEVVFMPVVNVNNSESESVIFDYIDKLNPEAFELIMNHDTCSVLNRIGEIRKSGARLWLNTLWDSISGGHSDNTAVENPDGTYGWAIEKGFTIIQTDRPKLLLNYLRERNLHE